MGMTLKVVVPPHPLIAHWLTMLRDINTPAPLYAKGLEELGKWLTYEALRDWLPHQKQQVITTQGKSDGTVIAANIPLLALPQIPGGLELWYGARKVLPNAHLCLGGVPNCIDKNAGIIIFLDQILDGADLIKTLTLLNKQNIESRRIRVISALSSRPGLQRVGQEIQDLNIFCACIDAEITDNGEISPGIGNPSLRLNTKTSGLL